MRYLIILGGILMPLAIYAQSIVGIGSSTISGEGATPSDSAWLNLLRDYCTQQDLNVTITNLGWSGSTSFDGMPSSYKTPTMVFNDSTPYLSHNITYAWTFNPDIVVIAYPSNDVVLNFTVTQWLSNLRTIYDSVVIQGKTAWMATSQPRNDVPMDIRQLLKEARDSILLEFAGHVLNFYDPLADPVTLGFKAGLTDDGIHPNNAGHQLLFQVALDADILGITPLPLSITGFGAVWNKGAVDLQWQAAGDGHWSGTSVQRSGNGIDFTDIWQEPVTDALAVQQKYTDDHPLTGRSFYRIKLMEGPAIHFSQVASIENGIAGWSLGRLYSMNNGAQWSLGLNSSAGGKVTIRVIGADGKILLLRESAVSPPTQSLSLDLSTLAAGQYFLDIRSEQGPIAIRVIQRW